MLTLNTDKFQDRHIGPSNDEIKQMLEFVGVSSLEELIGQTVPSDIYIKNDLNLKDPMTEHQFLQHMETIGFKNEVCKSFIGQGYYNTITPAVIRRNILENPGWYTQYTPYQAEISQGRLEALLNFQTMVSDLTGMPIANSSLLDEGTAAAEAMLMFYNHKNRRSVVANKIMVSSKCFPQTIDVVKGKAKPLGIDVIVSNDGSEIDDSYFAILLQYPDVEGEISSYGPIIQTAKSLGISVIMAADLLSLCLLKSPAELGADCAVGNTQRFGVPMGFGGPHAAYFSTTEEFKRLIPGRIIGVSKDAHGKKALRMALQTREQHIRREKATSNICTAQALLAIMAGMYAVYHGAGGLKSIAESIYSKASILKHNLNKVGSDPVNSNYFDTLTYELKEDDIPAVRSMAEGSKLNFRYNENHVSISVDQTTAVEDLEKIIKIFARFQGVDLVKFEMNGYSIPDELKRESEYLTHPVFNTHHSETELMRYIKELENKDLSLTKSMIPLGSCTMKLNAAAELEPISWSEFANIHPFAPESQFAGYQEMILDLEKDLAAITGFDACSLQPNSGAQGEYSGLITIREYQESIGEGHRNVILIPSSAHGTNPASAVIAGCKVVVVQCDKYGNISMEHLSEQVGKHKDSLCALMITYPSTHGVFEHHIMEVCKLIHDNGGQVYMDGANMNAQVGITNPSIIGADVCHLNLHKTFGIPHGGGGPGVGPICVAEHLTPFLPSTTYGDSTRTNRFPVSSAPYGSASVLIVSYGYIKMLGAEGMKKCTQVAILNANYIKSRLEDHYDILYVGKENSRVAHELILDMRPFKHKLSIDVDDIAKRLMDYGFHAPTISWPVPGTMMIEPTESEDKAQIDRFCDAMIEIRKEIEEIEKGEFPADSNVLKNAPHTLEVMINEQWDYPYSTKKALIPLAWVSQNKFWPSVSRVDNSYGDRNLVCTCPPIETYMEPVAETEN
ncbi:MAG: aminomethyl-transferring glycine dehydrogenase [Chitinophagales bacterium]|nr:aminomethyl-transferring glycine dehydrogenase [Chitinophagales bacterium]